MTLGLFKSQLKNPNFRIFFKRMPLKMRSIIYNRKKRSEIVLKTTTSKTKVRVKERRGTRPSILQVQSSLGCSKPKKILSLPKAYPHKTTT